MAVFVLYVFVVIELNLPQQMEILKRLETRTNENDSILVLSLSDDFAHQGVTCRQDLDEVSISCYVITEVGLKPKTEQCSRYLQFGHILAVCFAFIHCG